jgi:hypothetical protein
MKLTKEQSQEIKDQQGQQNQTKRVTAPALENILYEAMPALDHGFVRVIDYMEMTLQLFSQLEFHMEKEPNKFQQMQV